MLNKCTASKLAERCQQESEKYFKDRPHDQVYCLELLRRAFLHGDQEAWQVVYIQYKKLVIIWVCNHSKFSQTGEEEELLANEAFTRFWQGLSRRKEELEFDNLGSFLLYLKSCAHSAIEDACRKQQRWPQQAMAWDELTELLMDEYEVSSDLADDRELLMQMLQDRLQGEEERIVARLSWTYGLPPRDIQAQHPKLFADVAQVYRIKRNILNRLLRDADIQKLYDM